MAAAAGRANKTAGRPVRREDKIRPMPQRATLTIAGWLLVSIASAQAQTVGGPHSGDPAAPAYVPAYRALPKAEMRRRLIHCATEWQKLKATGKDAGMIWRDFADVCTAQPADAIRK